MAVFWQDIHYALRRLKANWTFTLVVALTLALGIGANTAMFSVLNAVLLRPLPFRDPGRLVTLWTAFPAVGVHEDRTSTLNVEDISRESRSFEDVAIADPVSTNLTGGMEATRVSAAAASANLFPLLGVAPAIGRTYTADEEQRRERLVVLSFGLWQRQFGGALDVVHQTIEIDGAAATIVGVMPADFAFPDKHAQFWFPSTILPSWDSRLAQRDENDWLVIARLRDGVSVQQARTELSAVSSRLAASYPKENRGIEFRAVPLLDQMTGEQTPVTLLVLFAAVGCVLLIACFNVANLLLARSSGRSREIALRTALGASRPRLIRQLLVESTVLASLAGLLGLVFAQLSVELVKSMGPGSIPRLDEANLDWHVLLFTAAVSIGVGVLFGLAPALRISQTSPAEALRGGTGRTTGGGGGLPARRMLSALVVAEFAVAVLLLSGAGLLIRSLRQVQKVDPGYDPENVLLLSVSSPRTETPERRIVLFDEVLRQIRAQPGVVNAGAISDFFIGINIENALTIEGQPQGNGRGQVREENVNGNFFETMHVPLVRGRLFTADDNASAAPVAVINEAMARRYWPNEDPLGKRVKLGAPESPAPWLTVAGVVGDMHRRSLEDEPIPQIFRPFQQGTDRGMQIAVRVSGDPTSMAATLRAAVQSVDPRLPVYGVASLDRLLGASLAQRRFQTWLLSLFSAAALLLAAIGIYGVLGYSVAQRTQEFGIRMALGAPAGRVVGAVVKQGLGLAAGGLAIGLAGAALVSRALSSLLFGVHPNDALTFGAVLVVLASVAALACYLPARRVTRIDPVIALRNE